MTEAAGHKPLEDAPGRPERLLQIVIDSIPQRVFWKDRNFLYLGCNRSFARDAGLDDPSLIVGKSDFDLAWKATAHLYVADDRLVMESNTPNVDIEEPMTFTDGRTIWLRTSKVPLRDASGAVFGVLGTYEDVTERRQSALDLHESEERFRATFEQAAVGISHVGTDGRFLRVNRRLCEKLGYTREELLERTFQEITHPADLPADLENVRRMLAGEIQAYSMEKRYIRKDGTAAWIALTVSLARDAEGRPKYFISVIEDIEPRRRAEEQEARLRNQLEHARLAAARDRRHLAGSVPLLGDRAREHRVRPPRPRRRGDRARARLAQAHEFIERLPEGYDTVIGERGITLSGGQRQRIAIARALVVDPRILILDDATASVDATTEAQIRLGLREAMEDRTTVIIAHRLSTIALADEIVVLDRRPHRRARHARRAASARAPCTARSTSTGCSSGSSRTPSRRAA